MGGASLPIITVNLDGLGFVFVRLALLGLFLDFLERALIDAGLGFGGANRRVEFALLVDARLPGTIFGSWIPPDGGTRF